MDPRSSITVNLEWKISASQLRFLAFLADHDNEAENVEGAWWLGTGRTTMLAEDLQPLAVHGFVQFGVDTKGSSWCLTALGAQVLAAAKDKLTHQRHLAALKEAHERALLRSLNAKYERKTA